MDSHLHHPPHQHAHSTADTLSMSLSNSLQSPTVGYPTSYASPPPASCVTRAAAPSECRSQPPKEQKDQQEGQQQKQQQQQTEEGNCGSDGDGLLRRLGTRTSPASRAAVSGGSSGCRYPSVYTTPCTSRRRVLDAGSEAWAALEQEGLRPREHRAMGTIPTRDRYLLADSPTPASASSATSGGGFGLLSTATDATRRSIGDRTGNFLTAAVSLGGGGGAAAESSRTPLLGGLTPPRTSSRGVDGDSFAPLEPRDELEMDMFFYAEPDEDGRSALLADAANAAGKTYQQHLAKQLLQGTPRAAAAAAGRRSHDTTTARSHSREVGGRGAGPLPALAGAGAGGHAQEQHKGLRSGLLSSASSLGGLTPPSCWVGATHEPSQRSPLGSSLPTSPQGVGSSPMSHVWKETAATPASGVLKYYCQGDHFRLHASPEGGEVDGDDTDSPLLPPGQSRRRAVAAAPAAAPSPSDSRLLKGMAAGAPGPVPFPFVKAMRGAGLELKENHQILHWGAFGLLIAWNKTAFLIPHKDAPPTLVYEVHYEAITTSAMRAAQEEVREVEEVRSAHPSPAAPSNALPSKKLGNLTAVASSVHPVLLEEEEGRTAHTSSPPVVSRAYLAFGHDTGAVLVVAYESYRSRDGRSSYYPPAFPDSGDVPLFSVPFALSCAATGQTYYRVGLKVVWPAQGMQGGRPATSDNTPFAHYINTPMCTAGQRLSSASPAATLDSQECSGGHAGCPSPRSGSPDGGSNEMEAEPHTPTHRLSTAFADETHPSCWCSRTGAGSGCGRMEEDPMTPAPVAAAGLPSPGHDEDYTITSLEVVEHSLYMGSMSGVLSRMQLIPTPIAAPIPCSLFSDEDAVQGNNGPATPRCSDDHCGRSTSHCTSRGSDAADYTVLEENDADVTLDGLDRTPRFLKATLKLAEMDDDDFPSSSSAEEDEQSDGTSSQRRSSSAGLDCRCPFIRGVSSDRATAVGRLTPAATPAATPLKLPPTANASSPTAAASPAPRMIAACTAYGIPVIQHHVPAASRGTSASPAIAAAATPRRHVGFEPRPSSTGSMPGPLLPSPPVPLRLAPPPRSFSGFGVITAVDVGEPIYALQVSNDEDFVAVGTLHKLLLYSAPQLRASHQPNARTVEASHPDIEEATRSSTLLWGTGEEGYAYPSPSLAGTGVGLAGVSLSLLQQSGSRTPGGGGRLSAALPSVCRVEPTDVIISKSRDPVKAFCWLELQNQCRARLGAAKEDAGRGARPPSSTRPSASFLEAGGDADVDRDGAVPHAVLAFASGPYRCDVSLYHRATRRVVTSYRMPRPIHSLRGQSFEGAKCPGPAACVCGAASLMVVLEKNAKKTDTQTVPPPHSGSMIPEMEAWSPSDAPEQPLSEELKDYYVRPAARAAAPTAFPLPREATPPSIVGSSLGSHPFMFPASAAPPPLALALLSPRDPPVSPRPSWQQGPLFFGLEKEESRPQDDSCSTTAAAVGAASGVESTTFLRLAPFAARGPTHRPGATPRSGASSCASSMQSLSLSSCLWLAEEAPGRPSARYADPHTLKHHPVHGKSLTPPPPPPPPLAGGWLGVGPSGLTTAALLHKRKHQLHVQQQRWNGVAEQINEQPLASTLLRFRVSLCGDTTGAGALAGGVDGSGGGEACAPCLTLEGQGNVRPETLGEVVYTALAPPPVTGGGGGTSLVKAGEAPPPLFASVESNHLVRFWAPWGGQMKGVPQQQTTTIRSYAPTIAFHRVFLYIIYLFIYLFSQDSFLFNLVIIFYFIFLFFGCFSHDFRTNHNLFIMTFYFFTYHQIRRPRITTIVIYI
eukprot:gene11890-8175_t